MTCVCVSDANPEKMMLFREKLRFKTRTGETIDTEKDQMVSTRFWECPPVDIVWFVSRNSYEDLKKRPESSIACIANKIDGMAIVFASCNLSFLSSYFSTVCLRERRK